MLTLYMLTNTVKGIIKNAIDTVKYAFKFIIGYIKVKYVYTVEQYYSDHSTTTTKL